MIIIKKEKKLKEEKPVLDERKKCHLEFLSKLNSFYEYFHKEINEHKNYKSSTEGCLYIINPKLIENLKEFYYYDEIKSLFEKDKKISEIIKSLSDEYIKKIQKQNDDIIRDQIYFYPHTKLYENLNLKYFINSTIVDSDLIKILYKDKDISNKLENSRVFYSISNRKLILRYGLIINIGNLDDNNIFNSDILIMCSSKSFESTYKEIKSMSIDNFINNVKIIEKNIGNYKEDNKVVFINENYIPETPQKDNNTPLYSPTSKKEEVGKQNGQIPMNSEYIYNNGILPIPVNMMKNTLSHHSEDNNSLLQSEKFLNTLNINKAPSLNMNVGNLGLQNMQGQQLMNIIYEIQRKNQNIPQNNENIAKQNEEKQKKMLEEQKMKEIMKKKNQIEKLIYIMIDLRKTNIKINLSLDKNTYYEKYYLINSDWFNEFSKNSQMNILFNNNIIFNSIKAVACNNFNMSNKNILDILKKDKTVEKEIDNIYKLLKENNLAYLIIIIILF